MRKYRFNLLVVAFMLCSPFCSVTAQNDDEDDIWKSIEIDEVNYQKKKSHCMRIYGYYRFIDDGVMYAVGRKDKLLRVSEGICELDVRYSKDEDDGAEIMTARNLVHAEEKGQFVDYYELKPYTFLEKARKMPKHYTMETSGDTTRVYTKLGLAGTVVRDTLARELRMSYNALSPDTALNINLLIVKAHLAHVDADAIYRIDDPMIDYVPQGNLKKIVFEGDLIIEMFGEKNREDFHERTELYVDSVVYLTKDEYKADKKLSKKERRERAGYTDKDIDRLKQKHGVPPLSSAILQKIEEQRDWDDENEHWRKTRQNR